MSPEKLIMYTMKRHTPQKREASSIVNKDIIIHSCIALYKFNVKNTPTVQNTPSV